MRHILVVDKEPATCEIVRFAVEADGTSRASAARNAEDALRIITADRPDAAVVDAVLPQGGGLSLAAQAIDLGVPVLIVTGDTKTRQRLDAVGCRYLAKPLKLVDLAIELRELLDEASERRNQLSAQLHRLAENMRELSDAIATTRKAVARAQDSRARAQRTGRRGPTGTR